MSELSNYASNSHKSKAEAQEKKVEKVVNGAVKVKKKNGVGKLADVFISEDASNVKNYIFMEVLVPAIKKAVSDIVRDGIDMILYGEKGASRQRSTNAGYVSYNRYSDRRDDRTPSVTRARARYDFDNIVIDYRDDAEQVLFRMKEIQREYDGMVSVADFYGLVGLPNEFTDHKFGWTDLRDAEVVRAREGGWTIRLPRAVPLT